MKLAMILIVLGALLLIGSGSRIADEVYNGNLVEVLDGLLVSIAIGGFLLYKGLRRYSKQRTGPR